MFAKVLTCVVLLLALTLPGNRADDVTDSEGHVTPEMMETRINAMYDVMYERLKTDFQRVVVVMESEHKMQIQQMENTINELKQRIEAMEREKSGQVGYNTTDELEERVAVLEVTVVELDEDIDGLDAELNLLTADVTDLDNDLEDIELRVDAEEDTSETHNEQIAALQFAYDSLTERVGNVEETQQGIANFSFLTTFSLNPVSVTDGEILVFDEVKINTGDNYNPLSGEFTAPVDGAYLFTVHIMSHAQVHGGCFLRVDGVGAAFTRQRDELEFDHPFELTVLLELTTGQIVDVVNYVQTSIRGSNSGGYMLSWFTGYLVRAN